MEDDLLWWCIVILMHFLPVLLLIMHVNLMIKQKIFSKWNTIYSVRVFLNGNMLSIFLFSMTTTSPGSISLMNLAPMISSAHVSDARVGVPSKSPSTSGLSPFLSLAPIIIWVGFPSGQREQTVICRRCLRRFESSPHHQP